MNTEDLNLTDNQEPKEKERLEIRTYTEEYKDQVVSLINNILEDEFSHHSESGRPDIKDISQYYQEDAAGDFWIGVDEKGEVVGTIALSNYGEGTGYLQRFMVKKEFRGEGVGKKLLSHLLDFAKSNGYKEIYLSTSEDMAGANRFYQKNGFEKVDHLPGKLANQSTWDNVFYKLNLTENNKNNKR